VSTVSKKVRDAMSQDVWWAAPTDSVADAAATIKRRDVGSVPVVDRGLLIAILTNRDIVVRTVAEGVDPGVVDVGEIASRELVTVRPDENLDRALVLMAHHRIRRLPVVEDGRLVGMLAQADVAAEAKHGAAGEMLAEVSEDA
jgi:CBS domain-containing protein